MVRPPFLLLCLFHVLLCVSLLCAAFRWLRLYDLRTRDEVLACHAHPKAVFGVSFDPFDENRFLTYSDEPAGIVKG